MPPADGKKRHSRFRVLSALGQGGMGSVQLVLQTTPAGVERLAVMKRPRPELARHPEFADMFWEEARVAITLNHPNVVHTYEAGEDAEGYFLLLEFLRGQSYAEVLTQCGYDDYRLSLEVALGTLQGLEYAHRAAHPSGHAMGIVHRDISPPNLFAIGGFSARTCRDRKPTHPPAQAAQPAQRPSSFPRLTPFRWKRRARKPRRQRARPSRRSCPNARPPNRSLRPSPQTTSVVGDERVHRQHLCHRGAQTADVSESGANAGAFERGKLGSVDTRK